MGNGVIRRIDLKAPGNPVTTVPADTWLYRPSDVAAKADGTLYVVETGMARVVEIRNGRVSVVAGSTPGYADGAPGAAQLIPYLGIAVLGDGSVAVADPGNHRIRRILFGPDGKAREVTTLAGSGRFGARDGDGQSAEFVLPAGLTVGPDGTLYVADSGNALLRAVTDSIGRALRARGARPVAEPGETSAHQLRHARPKLPHRVGSGERAVSSVGRAGSTPMA